MFGNAKLPQDLELVSLSTFERAKVPASSCFVFASVLLVCPSVRLLVKYKFLFAAPPEECKLMRAFAQILLLFTVGSHGEWSCLQQGDDSQVSFIFLILIPLILFVNLTMESSDSINEQFAIFKQLSYCFGETVFDVKTSFSSRPVSRLIR